MCAGNAFGQELEEPKPRTPFDRNRFSLGIALGSQNFATERYFVAGGSFGYFVLDGLEVGVGGAKWFGPDPSIAVATPTLRFIAYMVPGSIKPFVGSFYRHWFIGEPFDDIDSVGGTAGIVWYQGHVLLSVGATLEKTLTEDVCGDDCVDIYPAFNVSLSL